MCLSSSINDSDHGALWIFQFAIGPKLLAPYTDKPHLCSIDQGDYIFASQPISIVFILSVFLLYSSIFAITCYNGVIPFAEN